MRACTAITTICAGKLSSVWLRSKIDLRYDSCFQFANIKIGNISGALQQHPIRLDSISGNIKFGIDDFVKIDTLKGRIGNSDFNCSMRLYAGKDTVRDTSPNDTWSSAGAVRFAVT